MPPSPNGMAEAINKPSPLAESNAAYHGRAWRLALLTLGAMLLAGAGLLAQHWCRVPPRDEPKGRERGERDS